LSDPPTLDAKDADMTWTRPRSVILLAALPALLTLAACSGDDENQPPTAEIVYPDPGYRYTSAPDSVVVDARDDSGVSSVEIRLDDEVLSVVRDAPYSTRLPLGRYADGREHVLDATAVDSRGLEGGAGAITITIDPSLQTIPQIVATGPAGDGSSDVELRWLEFPGVVDRYEWQVAGDEGFTVDPVTGDVNDTSAIVPVAADGLGYARVRVVVGGVATDWSRTARYVGLEVDRVRYDLPGPQLGTRIFEAPDGTLRILSHGVDRHRVSTAEVQLLALDDELQLEDTSTLLSDDYMPLASLLGPDGDLVLAGRQGSDGAFVARASLDGQITAQNAPAAMLPSALAVRDGAVLALGRDRRDGARPGGVIATVQADASLAIAAQFALGSGRELQHAWPQPDGGWILAGQEPDIAGEDDDPDAPGGVWIRGLGADLAETWSLRLGTADRWLLRGAATDGAGRFLLTGIAFRDDFFSRYGFVACVDDRGRLLWTVTDRDWHLFAGAAPDADGRWAVAGVARRSVGDRVWEYDFALRGFSAAGAPLWEAQHRLGRESQAWSLLVHPDGGWWAVGTGTDDGSDYDVDLLRTDDRGALD
jgi:hypothetical protein